MTADLENRLRARARDLGFEQLRISRATLPAQVGERLQQAVGDGLHGSMDWLADTADRRRSPDAMWEDARSAITLAMSYAPDLDPMQRLEARATGVISVYALNRDYHDVIKGKLKELAGWLAAQTGEDVKVFVDTAPLMEKPLAAQAGVLAGRASTPTWFRANLARGSSSARSLVRRSWRPTRRRRIIAARAAPASTSARRMPFPRPTGSMRGAAFPT
jgi:hypothetical protein